MLHGRTTVLVTNLPWIVAQADLSVNMENGRIDAVERNIAATRSPVVLDKENLAEDDNPAVSGTASGSEAKPKSTTDKKDDIKDEMAASSGSGRMMCKNPSLQLFLVLPVNKSNFVVFKYLSYFGNPLYAIFAIFTSLYVFRPAQNH